MHDLSREEMVPALRAWAYVTGCGEPLAESLPASARWLLERWEAGDDHLPLGLVHDLGQLLLRGREFRFASARELSRWPADERAERLMYEDRVLGRWAVDPSVSDVHVAIAGMAPKYRDAAVAHAVGLALSGPLAKVASLARGNSALLRARLGELASLVPAQFEEWPALLDEAWRDWARKQLADCVAVLPAGRLFRAEDLWEIAHLPELPSESARLALREVHTVAARIGPVPPAVALSLRRRAREVPVDQDDSDHYPAGGFDAISTKGTFENLMRSEIAYVGEAREATGGIDLFDVRFAEGELLYYTRDESPLLDARREVTAVIDRPAEQRFKQPELMAQTLVMVEGLVLALQADLVRVFGPSGSVVRVLFRVESAEDRAAAEEELNLMGFTLAAEIAHRRVELGVAERWESVPSTGLVVFSPRPAESFLPTVAWVRVGDEVWPYGEAKTPMAEGAPALRTVADALLTAIARGQVAAARKKKSKSKGAAAPR